MLNLLMALKTNQLGILNQEQLNLKLQKNQQKARKGFKSIGFYPIALNTLE